MPLPLTPKASSWSHHQEIPAKLSGLFRIAFAGLLLSLSAKAADPFMVVPCYVQGATNADTIVRIEFSKAANLDGNINGVYSSTSNTAVEATRPKPTHIATNSQTGAIFGLAYDAAADRLYCAAYTKRKTQFGPGGTGAIYKIGNATAASPGTPTVYVDLNNVFGAGTAGTDPHPVGTNFNQDSATVSQVGKVSLGDLDLSPDRTKLYVVNMADRKLYVIPTSGALNSTTITRFAIPTSVSTYNSADVRPFGLGVKSDGTVYVGAVVSGEANPGDSTKLRALIWSFNGSAFSLVMDQPISTTRTDIAWNTWGNTDNLTERSSPMLSDIEFEGNNLIVGFRDRYGDQTPANDKSTTVSPWPRGYGDTLRAEPGGIGFVWQTNAGTFFQDVSGDGSSESLNGGLAIAPGGKLVASAYDAVAKNDNGTAITDNFNTGGVQVFDLTTGAMVGAYDFYRDDMAAAFGKVNGIGDVEMALAASPQAVGNLVFRDVNGDGKYTPGLDTGIAGVEVQLWSSTNGTVGDGDDVQILAGTDGDLSTTADNASPTLTDGNGLYLFKNITLGSYYIKVPASEFTSGRPLLGLQITSGNGSGTADDGTDHNAVALSGSAVTNIFTLAEGSSPTGESGAGTPNTVNASDDANTNLTIDLGFRCPDLLPNGSFEQGSTFVPNASKLGGVNNAMVITTAAGIPLTGITGSYSVQNAVDGAWWVQGPKAKDGNRYVLLRGIDNCLRVSAPAVFGALTQLQNNVDYQVCIWVANTEATESVLRFELYDTAGGDYWETYFIIPPNTTGWSEASGNATPIPWQRVCARIHLPANFAPATTGLFLTANNLDTNVPGLVLDGLSVCPDPTPKVGVGNLVFVDTNNDGIAQATEGINDIVVRLFRKNGTSYDYVADTLTKSGGYYLFAGLDPATYQLRIPASEFGAGRPLHAVHSIANGSAGDDNVGENGQDLGTPSVAGVSSADVVLALGTAPTAASSEVGIDASSDNFADADIDLTVDFGFGCPSITLSPGPLPTGVYGGSYSHTLTASGSPGPFIYSITAGSLPAGLTLSGTGAISGSPTSGGTASFTVTASDGICTGSRSYTLDVPVGNISGSTLEDTDGDGIGDVAINVTTISICHYGTWLPVDNPNIAGVQDYVITTTGGTYTFTNLAPGEYVVKQVQPTGYLTVSDLDSTDPTDDKANSSATDNQIEVEILAGETDSGNDFIEELPNTISGSVTKDTDNDGNGDTNMDGVTLTLCIDRNGDGDADDAGEGPVDNPNLVGEQSYSVTTVDGDYSFTGLPAASYVVKETQPFGYINVSDADTTIPGDDVANTSPFDNTLPVTVFGGENDTGNNFVEREAPKFNICGQVRFDSNRNGVLTDVDAGLAGFTVRLYADTDHDLVKSLPDTLLFTVVTDALGNYCFNQMPEGEYVVVQTPPNNTINKTGDRDGNNDRSIPISLAGGNSTQNDFLEAVDPQGWFYDVETCDIIPGGSVAVTTVPAGGVASIILDGSTGEFAWLTNGVAGVYSMTITPPAGYTLDPSRPAGPTLAPSGTSTYFLGSGPNGAGTQLLDCASAANPWHVSFDLEPGDPAVMWNNIPLLRTKPISFAGWQARNPLGGKSAATDDPDGDGFTNLEEFAFCYQPDTGAANGCPLVIEKQLSGGFNARVRRVTNASGLVYKLQALADLAASPGGWTDVTTIVPTVVTNPDGTEIATYAGIDTLPAFAAGQGFLRLSVTDTGSNTTVSTEVEGFTKRTLLAQCETFSMPYSQCALAAGKVDAVSGSALDCTISAGSGSFAAALAPGKQHYIEFTSGTHAGHRLEVDEASTTSTSIAIDAVSPLNTLTTLPTTLVGCNWTLQTHQTLSELFPVAGFPGATNNPSTASRFMLYPAGTFKIYWLYLNGGSPIWVSSTDLTLSDAGNTIVPAGAGAFIHPKGGLASGAFSGRVRSNPFAAPLGSGMTFVGGGWPLDQSPYGRGQTTGNGFVANRSASRADKVLFWKADSVFGGSGYENSAFLTVGGVPRWAGESDPALQSQNAVSLYRSFRAQFYKPLSPRAGFVLPLPWTPQ